MTICSMTDRNTLPLDNPRNSKDWGGVDVGRWETVMVFPTFIPNKQKHHRKGVSPGGSACHLV